LRPAPHRHRICDADSINGLGTRLPRHSNCGVDYGLQVTAPLTSALRPPAGGLDAARVRRALTAAGRPGPCLCRLRVHRRVSLALEEPGHRRSGRDLCRSHLLALPWPAARRCVHHVRLRPPPGRGRRIRVQPGRARAGRHLTLARAVAGLGLPGGWRRAPDRRDRAGRRCPLAARTHAVLDGAAILAGAGAAARPSRMGRTGRRPHLAGARDQSVRGPGSGHSPGAPTGPPPALRSLPGPDDPVPVRRCPADSVLLIESRLRGSDSPNASCWCVSSLWCRGW